MPNWCYTSYLITAPKEEISALETALNELTSKEYIQTDFGKQWYGNILMYLGYDGDKIRHKSEEDRIPNCRGWIDTFVADEDTMEIVISTAWSDHPETLLLLLRKVAPHALVTYYAEETGCEIFATNDHVYAGGYYIDAWQEEDEEDPTVDLFLNAEERWWPKDSLFRYLAKERPDLLEFTTEKTTSQKLSTMIAKLEAEGHSGLYISPIDFEGLGRRCEIPVLCEEVEV